VLGSWVNETITGDDGNTESGGIGKLDGAGIVGMV